MKNFFIICQIYLSNLPSIIASTFSISLAKIFGSVDSYKEFYCSVIIEGFESELLPQLVSDSEISLEECENIIYVAISYNTIPLAVFPSVRNEVFKETSKIILRKFRWKYNYK